MERRTIDSDRGLAARRAGERAAMVNMRSTRAD
jgi:hypothetical protein